MEIKLFQVNMVFFLTSYLVRIGFRASFWPLGSIRRKHGSFHLYADDSVIYLTFRKEG